MPTDEIPGRALVTRRATADIVRAAVLGSYGVAGFQAGPLERLRAAFGGRTAGLSVSAGEDGLAIRLHLRIATGLPVAEVARQVDSAVRYAVRRSLGREVQQLRIRVGGLETRPGDKPPLPPTHSSPGTSDLADSGADVA